MERMFLSPPFSSHSLFLRTSFFSMFIIFDASPRCPRIFVFMSFSESGFLVTFRPEGSPMRAVKSPIMKTILCPEVLKLTKFAKYDRVAEMQSRRGRVYAELHAQFFAVAKRLGEMVFH